MGIDDLWILERRLWLEGAPVFASHLAIDSVMICPGSGIMERDAILKAVTGAPRWTDVTLSGQHISRWDEVVVLAYVALAERVDGERFGAVCSSTYTDRRGRWMLLCHQQTLID